MPEFISEARRLRQITHLPMAGYKKEQTTLPGVNFPISYCVADCVTGSTYDSDSYRLGSILVPLPYRDGLRGSYPLKDQVGFFVVLLPLLFPAKARLLRLCPYERGSLVLC